MLRTSVRISACCVLVGCVANLQLIADELRLKSGATLTGKSQSIDNSAGTHSFRSDHGVQIAVTFDAVAEAIVERPHATIYREMAPSIADSVTSHWAVAEWCRQHNLARQRVAHLERIVQLNPNHVAARRALGFSQIDGRWATQRQVLREKGYVYYHGRWRLQQEVDLLEERQREREVHRRWLGNLRHWRALLNTTEAAKGSHAILAVRDPTAVQAIAELLNKERNRRVRLLYVEALGRIDGGRAVVALANNALHDRDEEAFLASVDQLARRPSPDLVRRFTKVLQNSNSSEINRAGFILGKLNDPSAIPSLIEALVTIHVIAARNPGQTTYAFGKLSRPALAAGVPSIGGLVGSTFAFRRASATSYWSMNQNVLDALIDLADGVSFGYDQPAWRHWYSTQQTPF